MAGAPKANLNIALALLYCDEAFLAVDKPAGLVTQPGAGHREDSMMNGLFATQRQALTRVGEKRDWGLLHRLDRETSGVVLVARSQDGYDKLRKAFEKRLISKTYLAVVCGRLPHAQGTCTAPLQEVRRGDMKVSVIAQRGEEAITHWRVLSKEGARALVAVAIESGRLHQIRAHMAYLGAPVEGDRVYRSLLPPNTSATAPKPASGRAHPAPGQLRLHAWRVAFAHPFSGKPIEIEAPLPPAMVESARTCLGSRVAIEGLMAKVRLKNWWEQPTGNAR